VLLGIDKPEARWFQPYCPAIFPTNMTSRRQIDIFQGTLDLLVLRTLRTESMHRWAISERIQQISKGVLQVNQGSLYRALHHL
jgi:DNA-binding HxlR family transcriptional regulator